MGWDSGARPVVLLTKYDLAPDGLEDELRNRVLGVDVIVTSTVTGEGVDDVRAQLQPARSGVLLGPSGAGKSSLANALLGGEQLATRAVRAHDHRGRHTTAARQLLVVPTGGVLIDTPGLRSLALAMDHGGVAATFPDIEELATQCRFADCRHDQEPGCAVLAAVEAGILEPDRLASYRKLSRELEYEARRDDPVAANETLRTWKARTKAMRRLYRERGT